MQSNEEHTDAMQRVTRSMRTRLSSMESDIIDLENRSDTPTRRLNSAKKNDQTDEAVMTPTKRAARGNSAIRNILEDQLVATSPLRRITRRMSSEAMASPLKQTLNESDGECIFVSEHLATPRTIITARNKTKLKLEEVLEEEPDVNDKINNSLNSNDSNNDLELRNRVITKSPVVLLTRIQTSPYKSIITETNEANITEEVSTQSPKKTSSKETNDDDEQAEIEKIKLEMKKVEEQLDIMFAEDENDTKQNSSEITSDKTSEPEINGDTSPNKIYVKSETAKDKDTSFSQKKSPSMHFSWNNSVAGQSNRIDKILVPAIYDEEQITTLASSPILMETYHDEGKESESESDFDERQSQTSLIIDEAEVADIDEESMTPSEREDLRLNEIPVEGESLGSQDSIDKVIESDSNEEEQDSFIDNEEIDDQYFSSDEEKIENESPKRRSRIILPSSDSSDIENEPELKKSPKRQSKKLVSSSESDAEADLPSPMKENGTPEKNGLIDSVEISPKVVSPSKSPKVAKRPFQDLAPKRFSLTALQSDKTPRPFISPFNPMKKMRESSEEILSYAKMVEPTVERKRKRESVVHGAIPKRFKEMSPNESEAIHMENVEEELMENVEEELMENDETEVPVDIPKLINHCDEYLEKHNQELKAKIAMKRQKKKEKLLKREEAGNDVENVAVAPKKKKNKNKTKKQKLLAESEPEKNDMATKLSKQKELLEQKRERKKLKKELKAAAKEKVVVSMDSEVAPVKAKKKKDRVSTILQPKLPTVVHVTVVHERKNKKRRIEDVANDEDMEKQKAKKKLKILQETEQSQHKYASNVLQTSSEENIISTVSAKLKKVIPKGLDRSKKSLKKKARGKVVPEPKFSLPRPVWTSAGVFIEESIEPYPFKPTLYKPRKVDNATEFRVIPFESKSKKSVVAAMSKNSKMNLILQRNKKGRDGSKKNIKNLI